MSLYLIDELERERSRQATILPVFLRTPQSFSSKLHTPTLLTRNNLSWRVNISGCRPSGVQAFWLSKPRLAMHLTSYGHCSKVGRGRDGS